MANRLNPPHDPQGDLFKTELVHIIDMNHPLVRLGGEVNGECLEGFFGETYCEDNGRPATNTRVLVVLHCLKYTFNLSDEDVFEAWGDTDDLYDGKNGEGR